MTRFCSRRITDLNQSEIRNMTRECEGLHRFRVAKRNTVPHEPAERLQGFGPAAEPTPQFYYA